MKTSILSPRKIQRIDHINDSITYDSNRGSCLKERLKRDRQVTNRQTMLEIDELFAIYLVSETSLFYGL